MTRRRFRNCSPCKAKCQVWGHFTPCQSENPKVLQIFVQAGTATETQPPQGTELWDFVGLWVQNTFIEGVLWGLGPFLPTLQPQIPQLHYSSLKSFIRAINPTGLSHLFVCFFVVVFAFLTQNFTHCFFLPHSFCLPGCGTWGLCGYFSYIDTLR